MAQLHSSRRPALAPVAARARCHLASKADTSKSTGETSDACMGHGDWGEKQVCSSSCNNSGGAWCYIYTPSHEFINRWMVHINSCPSLSPYSFQSNPWGRDSTLLPRPPLPPRSSPTPPVSARPKPLPTPPPTVAVIVSSPALALAQPPSPAARPRRPFPTSFAGSACRRRRRRLLQRR